MRRLPDLAYRAIGRFSNLAIVRYLHPRLYRRFGGRSILGHVLGAEQIVLTTRGVRTGRARSVALFAFDTAAEAGAAGGGAAGGATEAGATEAGATEAGATEAGAAEAGATEAGATEAGAARTGWIVVGSRGGSGRVPDWARNLEAEPRAVVQLHDRHLRVRARFLEGDEYERAFELAAAGYPGYRVYRAAAGHRIPVVRLEPDEAVAV